LPYNTSVETRLVSNGNPLIFVIDRGNCFFAKKIRNAQDAGAKAVLVVNNEDEELPYMADDGTGGVLSTPSLVIDLAAGNRIKAALNDASQRDFVGAVMQFGIPEADGKVQWVFWTSSDDEQSSDFKVNFGSAAAKLGDDLLFTPHYLFLTPSDIGCDPSGGLDSCIGQCTNSNKYCFPSVPGNTYKGIDVVEQNLVQLCLYDYTYKSQDKKYSTFWDYLKRFQQECVPNNFNRGCSDKVLGEVGVPADVIQNCIRDSNGVGVNDPANKRIEEEMRSAENYGIYAYPRMFINDVPFLDTLSCPKPIDVTHCGVLSAICSGYGSDRPDSCYNSNGCPFGVVRDECGVCGGSGKPEGGTCDVLFGEESLGVSSRKSDVVSSGTVVLITLSFIAVAGAGFFVLLRRSQAGLRRELADIMSSYAPLEERDMMPGSFPSGSV
jgi:hypothetical protein